MAQIPARKSREKATPPHALDELLLATFGLINAVKEIYGAEFDPESNLYRRMKLAEKAADVFL
jgi:hypothetical protein